MTKRLHLADGFDPPIDLMTQKIAILARTGAGKTNTATVIAEEVLDAKQQVVVLDPKGDWWGLRSSPDGKAAGYPITVLGGDHGDLPLEHTAGKVIADVAADGASLVLDLSAFSNAERNRFVTDFAEHFYRAKAQHVSPVLVVLEEADEVVPQRFTGEAARMVGAIERIVKRGRFRGIGTLLVTQRSASLNKDVLTQTEVLIVQQTTSPQDKKAIDAWVESHPDQEKREELMANIASLKKGEAFVWSPTFLEEFFRTRFRMRRTFDAGRDVKIGEFRPVAFVLAPVDLAALGARMQATIERAKQDDPKALRALIVKLQGDVKRAMAAAPTPVVETKIVKERILTAEDRELIARLIKAMGAKFRTEAYEMAGRFEGILEEATRIVSALSAGVTKPVVAPAVRAGLGMDAAPGEHRLSKPEVAGRTSRPLQPQGQRIPARTIDLGRGERRVLIAIAQHDGGVTRDQLSVLVGYKRSTRDTYVQRLREAGLADLNGGGTIIATDAGVAALGDDFETLPTGNLLLQHWMEKLPAGEMAVFAAVVAEYPKAVQRAAIDEIVTYKRSTRDTYLQRLAARRLVVAVGPGEVRAAETLFG